MNCLNEIRARTFGRGRDEDEDCPGRTVDLNEGRDRDKDEDDFALENL